MTWSTTASNNNRNIVTGGGGGGGGYSSQPPPTTTRTRTQTRSTRPTYLPPHLRSTTATTAAPFYPGASTNSLTGGGGVRTWSGLNPAADPFYMRDHHHHPYPLNSNNAGARTTTTTTGSAITTPTTTGGGGCTEEDDVTINFEAYEDIPVEATGLEVPPPVASFDEVELAEVLRDNIRRCKYVKPTPIQRHAIPAAVAGRDLMACAQTGSGKTAAFCFPIIHGVLKDRNEVVGSGSGGWRSVGGGSRVVACPSALILSPTRELSCQIYEEAKKFAYNSGVKIVVAYGGAPIFNQLRNLEKGVDILVATPGRLVDMIERAKVSLRMIKYLALDEADRMLDMGFEPQIRKIVQQMEMPPPGQRQTMLFSATFPHEIQMLAADFLSDYIFITVGRVGSSTDLIEQRVEHVQDGDKRSHLMNLLRTQKSNGAHGKLALTLIFVETKKGADSLERWLSLKGFPATAIHGDKVQMERERALKSFKSGATPILVATDVASRGLDIPHVSHVINFDLPKDIDAYVHRIGRTGRAGKAGLATAFFDNKNTSIAKQLVELMKEANQQVPSWLNEFAESSSYYGGSGSKSYNSGGKFGGYDFRHDTYSPEETYTYPETSSDYYADTTALRDNFENYAAGGADSNFVATSGCTIYGNETIVATGWD